MKLIVGLGNPGSRYRTTPHNVGYEVVDELARRAGLRWTQARRIDAQFADGEVVGADCMLLKPTTYMNLSADAVVPLVRGENLDVARDLLVALDDAALPLGRIRLRAEGSSAGHRGLESLIEGLRGQKFARLRCGVTPEGEPPGDLAAFVLARWPKSLVSEVESMVLRAADAVEAWLTEDIDDVMSRFNRTGR
ncbi:aminoacyl-tRNA hydrolase [Candidatus Sumerlaeota bacterium]|nr:aminoacyl-tRNA hydrolase [Candidatus Sumerlaeota bacterium]